MIQTPVTVPTAVVVPAWLSVAFGEIGVREDMRVGHSNPRIERYHGITMAGEASDDVSSCASFVGYCLEMGGIRSTKSKSAASYVGYGQATLFRFGCVAFLPKLDPDAGGTGHVGFGLGLSGNTLYMLGCNQQSPASAFEPTKWQGVSIVAKDARNAKYRWPTMLAA